MSDELDKVKTDVVKIDASIHEKVDWLLDKVEKLLGVSADSSNSDNPDTPSDSDSDNGGENNPANS